MAIPDRYMQGRATMLVTLKDKKSNEIEDFVAYLKQKNFDIDLIQEGAKDLKFVWINMNSKSIHHGLLGTQMCEPFGNHAITIEEFKTIFEIFEKYQEKDDIFD